MNEPDKRWTKEKWLRLAFIVGSFASSMGLSVLFDSTQDGGYVTCSVLFSPFLWPASFLVTLARCVSSDAWIRSLGLLFLLAPLGYWPVVGYLGYRFLNDGKWTHRLGLLVLFVIPAVSAALVFEVVMGV